MCSRSEFELPAQKEQKREERVRLITFYWIRFFRDLGPLDTWIRFEFGLWGFGFGCEMLWCAACSGSEFGSMLMCYEYLILLLANFSWTFMRYSWGIHDVHLSSWFFCIFCASDPKMQRGKMKMCYWGFAWLLCVTQWIVKIWPVEPMIGQPINTAKSRAEIKKTWQKCPWLGLDWKRTKKKD